MGFVPSNSEMGRRLNSPGRAHYDYLIPTEIAKHNAEVEEKRKQKQRAKQLKKAGVK